VILNVFQLPHYTLSLPALVIGKSPVQDDMEWRGTALQAMALAFPGATFGGIVD
jgi:hypothetical protein